MSSIIDRAASMQISAELTNNARKAGRGYGEFLADSGMVVPPGPSWGVNVLAPSVTNPGYFASAFNGTKNSAKSLERIFGLQAEGVSQAFRGTPWESMAAFATLGPATAAAFWKGVHSALDP